MSNPLLRPNDPRFQKPEIRDPEGKNRFSEGSNEQISLAGGDEVYSSAATEEARPFLPQYEVQQHSRPTLLFVLAGVGWGAAFVGAFSLTGVFDVGWISPLLGV